jgi:choline dehydrogenase-like flavoprotein
MNLKKRVQVLVVGSGAGGAVTALELTRRGFEVVVLEEGSRFGLESYGQHAPDAMRLLYRRRGMTPIMGNVPIGYVEGRCIGGSTEINSGFWHRTPPEILLRWKAQYGLLEADPDELAPHFQWSEDLLRVGRSSLPWPKSTKVMAQGAEAMEWSYLEVPRTAPGCEHTNACAHGCPKGNKQGMSVSLIPAAEAAGARVIPNCRVKLLLKDRGRVEGVVASMTRADGVTDIVRIDAEHVFVCAGPTETPSLLRRSGIKLHVGDSLRIHPMLKLAARFPEEINAQESVLPLIQVKEFAHDISLGGSFFTPGHLSIILMENWTQNRQLMNNYRNMAAFYVAVRGTGRGTIRPSFSRDDKTTIRYTLSYEDIKNLSQGLARLSALLLAGGAEEIYPSAHGIGPIRTEVEAIRWLDELLPKSALSLTTVHAFSACPAGENAQKCATDSFGRVNGFRNLYLSDSSIIPDSPGVNPQGTVMALARRNAIRFAETVNS